MTRTESKHIGWWERLRQRLPRSEYLGIHLLVGWLLSLALLGLFIAISQTIGSGSPVARWDDEVAATFRSHREASPAWREFFLSITEMGSMQSISLVVICMGAVLLVLRRRLLL